MTKEEFEKRQDEYIKALTEIDGEEDYTKASFQTIKIGILALHPTSNAKKELIKEYVDSIFEDYFNE